MNFKIHALVVALLAVMLYVNTFQHEYALDDTVVIVKNEFVHRGVAGIPDILSKDAYFSYYDQLRSSNQLSGGRYRPLSIVTFAIEQQLSGAVPEGGTDSILAYGLGYRPPPGYERKFLHEMHMRHVVNVGLYALLAVVMLYFLRYFVFARYPLMALVATVLFVVHPIHTEVVANVKSRDEIMSLLFVCLTFIFALRYRQNRKVSLIIGALACYFLAFLSKEYAITLLVLLPVAFYVLGTDTLKGSILAVLPYLCIAVIYIIIRWQVIGPRNELSDNDIQINPYAYASPKEKVATEIATSLNYLRLLVFPHPLTSDYSYDQIPYKSFGDPVVWLSLAVHLAIIAGIVYFIRRRNMVGFAMAFYLANLLMVNNFLFDIGATMGERLIFHSSLGFCIAMASVLCAVLHRISSKPARLALTGSLMGVIVALCSFKTIQRNRDWKNDATLFMKDVETSPNSFLVNMNVATLLVNNSDYEADSARRVADLHKAVGLFSHVLGMQNDYVLGYMNRSIGYLKLAMPDSMMADLDRVKALYPIHPQLPEMYYRVAGLYQTGSNFGAALRALETGMQLNPRDTALAHEYERVKKAREAAASP